MLRAGLIGFPSTGKTTLFRLMTSARDQGRPPLHGKVDAHVGVSRVPDERLDRLTALFNPRRRVPAAVEFADVAGTAQAGAKDLLDVAPFRNADALLHVVRLFRDERVAHAGGSIDASRDARALEDELVFADLLVVERRLERLTKDLKKTLAIPLSMQSYRSIPIGECNDPLVAIPAASLAFTEPHPYVTLGAPYGDASPWMLRRRVLAALLQAADALHAHRPGWRLKLFDAYRPLPVQAFMVWREFGLQAAGAGRSLAPCRNPAELQAREPELYAALAATVFEFWGIPSDDPRTPPPHSTGAAVDLTLQDAAGQEVDMG